MRALVCMGGLTMSCVKVFVYGGNVRVQSLWWMTTTVRHVYVVHCVSMLHGL